MTKHNRGCLAFCIVILVIGIETDQLGKYHFVYPSASLLKSIVSQL